MDCAKRKNGLKKMLKKEENKNKIILKNRFFVNSKVLLESLFLGKL
jgi:hypothetical protein